MENTVMFSSLGPGGVEMLLSQTSSQGLKFTISL